MRLTVIGCSGSFPGPDSPASCYLVEAEGFRMVLDLGNGALGVLQRHIGLYDVDAVCLSHLHADHCLDLCSYWVARKYAPDGAKPPIPVYGPAGTADRMARAYDLPADPGMREVFDFTVLQPGVCEIGPFRVTVDRMNHPVETFGFRIEQGGRALAYSADTGKCAELVELARGVDLLLCEASFLDRPNLPTDLHLTGREAAEHAARADVGLLVLTHLVPWNDAARTLEEAREVYDGAVTLTHSGAVYDLDGRAQPARFLPPRVALPGCHKLAGMARPDGRSCDQLRPVRFARGWLDHAEGSVLVEFGRTRVLCAASVQEGVPRWRRDSGLGWVTAEYAMLPRATETRTDRESVKGRIGGRTHEISRLIGRSLRACVDFKALGENTIVLDCDVLQADGGTRTAAITGAYLALADAVDWLRDQRRTPGDPLVGSVAAVSVGVVAGEPRLDLCYEEDVAAETDMNVVVTGDGRFVEIQGTAESEPFDRPLLDRLLDLAVAGCAELSRMQQEARNA